MSVLRSTSCARSTEAYSDIVWALCASHYLLEVRGWAASTVKVCGDWTRQVAERQRRRRARRVGISRFACGFAQAFGRAEGACSTWSVGPGWYGSAGRRGSALEEKFGVRRTSAGASMENSLYVCLIRLAMSFLVRSSAVRCLSVREYAV